MCAYMMLDKNILDKGPSAGASLMAGHMVTPPLRNKPGPVESFSLLLYSLFLPLRHFALLLSSS